MMMTQMDDEDSSLDKKIENLVSSKAVENISIVIMDDEGSPVSNII